MRAFLRVAGVAGSVVLGLAGAAEAAPITKQVTLRVIQLCNDGGGDCAVVNTYEAAADKIWEQAGIDMKFLPTVSWNSSLYLTPNADTKQEIAMFGDGSTAFGDPDVTGIINLYFVKDLLTGSGTLYGEGCGAPIFAGYCEGEVGVVINATDVNAFNGGIGRIDTVAHEIGHVLGLTHDDWGAGMASNLMTSGGSRSVPGGLADITPDGAGLSVLSAQQVSEALGSSFVKDIEEVPEPASMMVLAMGLAGLALRRRAAS